jgi:hypothetical protein
LGSVQGLLATQAEPSALHWYPAAQHVFRHGTGNPGGQQMLLFSGLQALPAPQHDCGHETGKPDGQQKPGFSVLHVVPTGQQSPLHSGAPVGHEAPQV